MLERFIGLEIRPVRPTEFWLWENGLARVPTEAHVAFAILLGFVEALQKKQE